MKNPNTTPNPSVAEQLPSAISVGLGKWERTSPEKPVIETKGLGPCIGIALYDSATKTGHMAHMANPRDQVLVSTMMQSVRESSTNLDNVRVWLRGGQPHPDDATSLLPLGVLNREAVLRNLIEAGVDESRIDIEFDDAPMGTRSTHMRLDTNTGEFEAITPDLNTLDAIGQTALEEPN